MLPDKPLTKPRPPHRPQHVPQSQGRPVAWSPLAQLPTYLPANGVLPGSLPREWVRSGAARFVTNMDRFIHQISPALSMYVKVPNEQQQAAPQSPRRRSFSAKAANAVFYLNDLWLWYDLPFGLEIPIMLEGIEITVFYVPYLSAIHLYKRDSDSEALEPLFEYDEQAQPVARLPVLEKIAELTAAHPELANLRSDQVHASSWYSIAWSPLYINNFTKQQTRGIFLTYHRFCGASRSDAFFPVPPAPPSPAPAAALPESFFQRGSMPDDDLVPCGLHCPAFVGFIPYKVASNVWYVLDTTIPNTFVAPLWLG